MELGSESIRCSTLTISSDFLDANLNRVREQLGSDELKDVHGEVGSIVH